MHIDFQLQTEFMRLIIAAVLAWFVTVGAMLWPDERWTLKETIMYALAVYTVALLLFIAVLVRS